MSAKGGKGDRDSGASSASYLRDLQDSLLSEVLSPVFSKLPVSLQHWLIVLWTASILWEHLVGWQGRNQSSLLRLGVQTHTSLLDHLLYTSMATQRRPGSSAMALSYYPLEEKLGVRTDILMAILT
jgi:hypothetical protein